MTEAQAIAAALERRLNNSSLVLTADVERAAAELRRLDALCREWESKAATWLASPEAAQRLDGYRDLAQQVGELEAECEALRKDAERLNHFEAMADRGYCPTLVFDDDGRWAISYSGAAPVPESGGHTEAAYITVEVEPYEWQGSVREAIDAAMGKEKA